MFEEIEKNIRAQVVQSILDPSDHGSGFNRSFLSIRENKEARVKTEDEHFRIFPISVLSVPRIANGSSSSLSTSSGSSSYQTSVESDSIHSIHSTHPSFDELQPLDMTHMGQAVRHPQWSKFKSCALKWTMSCGISITPEFLFDNNNSSSSSNNNNISIHLAPLYKLLETEIPHHILPHDIVSIHPVLKVNPVVEDAKAHCMIHTCNEMSRYIPKMDQVRMYEEASNAWKMVSFQDSLNQEWNKRYQIFHDAGKIGRYVLQNMDTPNEEVIAKMVQSIHKQMTNTTHPVSVYDYLQLGQRLGLASLCQIIHESFPELRSSILFIEQYLADMYNDEYAKMYIVAQTFQMKRWILKQQIHLLRLFRPVDFKNQDGPSDEPAPSFNELQVLQFLCQHVSLFHTRQFDIRMKPVTGSLRTILHWSALYGWSHVVKWLLDHSLLMDHGMRQNAITEQDEKGNTAMHLAGLGLPFHHWRETVVTLAYAGAAWDASVVNHEGLSPSMIFKDHRLELAGPPQQPLYSMRYYALIVRPVVSALVGAAAAQAAPAPVPVITPAAAAPAPVPVIAPAVGAAAAKRNKDKEESNQGKDESVKA